jgi:CBS domain-containing membrane protein
MSREINIDLNIDQIGPGDRRENVARLVLVRACGFTRDGGTPTLSQDCSGYRALEAEAQRIKDEIDDALARARAYFEGAPAARAPAKPAPKRAEPAAAKPHIDTGLTVRDVMTREVRTVKRNDHLSLADELMRLGHFRHVVVLDDAGGVAGVLSSRDIFHGALAWSLGQGRAAHDKSLASYPVKQVMSAEAVTIAPDVALRDAAALMAEKKLGCLPVVEGGKLVGILTEGDFLAILSPHDAIHE